MKKDKNLIASKQDVMSRYPLATKTGIEMMLGLLIESGAMCPKCGYGTRVTSKRWAKCKKCGERVARNGL
jgi:tRNA(Ile2) C34 agmatinyltransferase TiaS